MAFRFIFAGCLALVACSAASAQTSFRVQPITVDVRAPSQATAVTLQNTGSTPVSLQLRVFEWTQVDGGDVIRPTTDVVVSPPAATVPGNSTYTVRVARTAGAVTKGEKSYRLWIDEIPVTATDTADEAAVEVRLRYDMPLFFGAANIAPDVTWAAYRSGDSLVVEATNRGERNARVVGLQVGDISFGKGLNGYVLPGATRRWTSPAGAKLPQANASVTLVAGVGAGEVRAPLKITSR
ncbi:molecular chaperone [Altererythrobacter sp. CC-YST694]|uniref:fimbrial biogenesis chaperone n=1 Tax=Altererythrobacter sp. CC-YST694 TaxID=2755038 RepID=UPI001D0183F4|nr:molecular chaperone [Altererythrobacter sp. CC-YST694]MCB5425948.1 molecular chaperone [Altererythrobacter sp. CC-YST694]